MDIAVALVSQFDRGGIRVAYRPGADLECETDSCVLPHLELQQLMSETLGRRDASLRVVVELAG